MNDLLSILQPEQYPVTLEIINKEIMVKPYNHGETKAFLELIDDYKKNKTGGMKKLFLAQKNLIDSCILADATGVKPMHSEQLHRADYVKLMVELKNITHGEQSITDIDVQILTAKMKRLNNLTFSHLNFICQKQN